MEALLLAERVKNAIQIGESDYREFKSAWEGPPGRKTPRAKRDICKDIGEALVAFANADGGELLIGIEDDGAITGLPHGEAERREMLAAPKTHVHPDSHLPILHAAAIQLADKTILFFSVQKGTTEIYQLPDGRCVRRKDKRTMPESIKHILFDRQEAKSREYDRQLVDGAAVNDLDLPFIQSLAERYLPGLTVEKYLQQLGLAEYTVNGLQLKMAALLLFAKDGPRWHPRCEVRILKVTGTEIKSGERYNVRSDETVRGNIFELIQQGWQQLKPYLVDKTEFGPDARFTQKLIYPELACREALINAIAHRDYTIHNSVEIFIFDDRLEIKSPGALLSTLTVADLERLEGVHESRNVLIGRVLRENEFMRELGEGIKRMFDLMAENELAEPQLYSNNNWFRVTLPHKSVFSAPQQEWLGLFPAGLTPHQKKIVLLGMNGREISPADIYRALTKNDRDLYDREVTALRKANILVNIRSNAAATTLAEQQNIPKQQIPRFKVQPPADPQVVKLSSLDERLAVFVGNLPTSVTETEIKQTFERCGPVQQVHLPLDAQTNQPKRFAFVWFADATSAARAIVELNGRPMRGRPISVRAYKP